jgi:hypothetical protein
MRLLAPFQAPYDVAMNGALAMIAAPTASPPIHLGASKAHSTAASFSTNPTPAVSCLED